MPADKTRKLPQERVPLPSAEEMPLLEAVYWIAFGTFPHPTTLSSDERDVFNTRERAFEVWCRSQPGDLSSRAYVVNQLPRRKLAVAIEDVRHLWPLRNQLDDAGLRFLRLSIKAALLHRSFSARFDLAQSELLEAAKSGSVSVRAKVERSDAIPEPLDPAYFHNPVGLDLLSGDIVGAQSTNERADDRTDTAKLKRYDPLVSVKDMASVFAKPVNHVSDGPTLKAARVILDERQGKRILRGELKEQLEKRGLKISARQLNRICKTLKTEFPQAFQRGRPRKNKYPQR